METFTTFKDILSWLVSKSVVELTVAELSRCVPCGGADAECCAGDATATPVFSCDVDNNGKNFDVPLRGGGGRGVREEGRVIYGI